MDNFVVQATKSTPYINIDYRTGHFALKGISSPEDVFSCYTPVYQAVRAFARAEIEKIEAEFDLEYFNTATARALYALLKELTLLMDKGIEVSVQWIHDEDDEKTIETINDLQALTSVPFRTVNN